VKKYTITWGRLLAHSKKTHSIYCTKKKTEGLRSFSCVRGGEFGGVRKDAGQLIQRSSSTQGPDVPPGNVSGRRKSAGGPKYQKNRFKQRSRVERVSLNRGQGAYLEEDPQRAINSKKGPVGSSGAKNRRADPAGPIGSRRSPRSSS